MQKTISTIFKKNKIHIYINVLTHNSFVTLLLKKKNTNGTLVLLTARPTLWDIDFANQLSSVTNQMPRNGLEEMIQWTKEGKMWRYPINNEDGEY